MTVRLRYSLFTTIAATLLLVSAVPFFLIGSSVVVFSIFTCLYIVCFSYHISRYGLHISKVKQPILMATLLLFFYCSLPFREYDRFLFVNIWFLVFGTLLFLKDDVILNIVRCFFDLIFLIAILAIAIVSIKALGFNIPSYEYQTGAVDARKSIYHIYPGTAELIHQDYNIFGRQLFRLSGIFSEPGHFGVICAMALFFNPALFSKFKRRVILCAGLLTLSMGFYVLFVTFILINVKFSVKNITYVLIGLCILSALYILLPEDFIFRFFGNKIGSNEDILNARTSLDFSALYSSHFLSFNWLFGGGADFLLSNGVTSSDYRAFILKFGVFGIFLYFLWFCSFRFSINSKKALWIGFSFLLIVFAHRSWMVGYLVFLFSVYTIPFSYNDVKMKKIL